MVTDILSTHSGEILDRMLTVLDKKKDTALMEFFGKSTASVSNARNKKVPNGWILEFSGKTGAAIDWLLTGQGPMFTADAAVKEPETKALHADIDANVSPARRYKGLVPLISWVQAGIWTEIVDNHQPNDADTWYATNQNVSRAAFALKISGSSMEPEYKEGDVIIVDPGYDVHNGALVVVRLNHENEATFKKIHMDGGRIFLEPLNPRYQPMEITGRDYTVCGVVRQMVRDV